MFGTIASRFNDDGVTALFHHLKTRAVGRRAWRPPTACCAPVAGRTSTRRRRSSLPPAPVPGRDRRDGPRLPRRHRPPGRRGPPVRAGGRGAAPKPSGGASTAASWASWPPRSTHERDPRAGASSRSGTDLALARCFDQVGRRPTASWHGRRRRALWRTSLSGTRIPGWPCPGSTSTASWSAGCAPSTSRATSPSPPGSSPSSGRARTRPGCSPARVTPSGPTAASTCWPRDSRPPGCPPAFDSVTLYGFDPDERPDIYGKIGTSGVSIATLDDMKALFDGFDLCDPTTSVSMTINGPAPTILAMFLNTAIDQRLDRLAVRAGPRGHRGRGDGHRGRGAPDGAGHGAGRHPEGGPGSEHLHLLDRVLPRGDGRHAGVVHRAPGAQLLLGVDLRLPHRRSRGQPDHPAGLHPGQRLHLRRVLPGPRHGRRRLRAESLLLLLERHGSRVHGASGGWPAGSGPSP